MTSKTKNLGVVIGVLCFLTLAIPFVSFVFVGIAISDPRQALAGNLFLLGVILLFAGVSTALGWSVVRRSQRLIMISALAYVIVAVGIVVWFLAGLAGGF